jgi:hypothetical protein
MASEVTIDTVRVMQMAKDAVLVQILPPLLKLKETKSGCRPCGAKKASGPTYQQRNDVLRDISNMLSGNRDLRDQVKLRLGATTIRVKYKSATKPLMVVTKL